MTKGYKALFYGPTGVGKSTLATFAESACFLDLDGGLEHIKGIEKSEKVNSFEQFYKECKSFLVQGLYKTLVVDSCDSLESLIFKQLIKSQDGIKSIEEYMGGYNKGYNRAKEAWEDLIRGIFTQITDSGKNIIFTGSCESVDFANPFGVSYTKFKSRINKTSLPVLESSLDGIFFIANSNLFNPHERTSMTEGESVVFCKESIAFTAKNRFDLPYVLTDKDFCSKLEKSFLMKS
jgi:hypothetical protein